MHVTILDTEVQALRTMWHQGNSVKELPDDDILASFRPTPTVVRISRKTRKTVWKLGPPTVSGRRLTEEAAASQIKNQGVDALWIAQSQSSLRAYAPGSDLRAPGRRPLRCQHAIRQSAPRRYSSHRSGRIALRRIGCGFGDRAGAALLRHSEGGVPCLALAPRLGLARRCDPFRRHPRSRPADVWFGDYGRLHDLAVAQFRVGVYGVIGLVFVSGELRSSHCGRHGGDSRRWRRAFGGARTRRRSIAWRIVRCSSLPLLGDR